MTTGRQTLALYSSFAGILRPARRLLSAITLATLSPFSMAQQAPPGGPVHSAAQSAQQNPATQQSNIVLPAGTRVALVLAHPLNSKSVHRGDEIYTQTTAPVVAGDQVAIPAGTFVQAKVEKLVQPHNGRAEILAQSVALVFPNGYVVDSPNRARDRFSRVMDRLPSENHGQEAVKRLSE